MIKNILTVGDSFTYGDELKSVYDAWPYRLADMITANVINLGQSGSGNKPMIRNVIQHVANNTPVEIEPIDLVIIGWTSPGRMEFSDAAGTYDIWPGYSGTLMTKANLNWRLELLEYINKHHDPEYIYRQYLQDIILTQSFLKQQGIKYLMMNTVSNEYYHRTYYGGMRPMANLIDEQYYLGWPTEGMAEWTNGCKKGPRGHFLEEGHRKVATKLHEYIGNLGWIS